MLSNPIIKKCKRHGDLDLGNIIKYGYKKGCQQYKCKLCVKEYNKNNYQKNKHYIIDRNKANPLSPLKKKIKLKLNKKYSKKTRNSLGDNYIKSLFCRCNSGLKFHDIPQELVDLKRLQLKLYRKLKQLC